MYDVYIQYTTDFHLLAALAAVDDLSNSKVTFIGPKTTMLVQLQKGLLSEHYMADPRKPNVNYMTLLLSFTVIPRKRNCLIISPFVYPFFTLNYLVEKKIRPEKIIRTDEGVGSYASIWHFYNSYSKELQHASRLQCFLRALLKVSAIKMTELFRLVETRYIFGRKLNINSDHVAKIKRNIEIIGLKQDLKGQMVFITQPNIQENFKTKDEFVTFIKSAGKKFGFNQVLIKKHPRDDFEYELYGLSLTINLPLEVFDVKESILFGFSSTALLTARVVGDCEDVYFVNMTNGILTFDSLSGFNQKLFFRYITPLEC